MFLVTWPISFFWRKRRSGRTARGKPPSTMNGEDGPKPQPASPPRPRKSPSPERKKKRRRKQSPQSPKPSDDATSAQVSECPADAGTVRSPVRHRVRPTSAPVSLEEVAQRDFAEEPEDEEYDSHVTVRRPIASEEPAQAVPHFTRKVGRVPRDSLIRSPGRKRTPSEAKSEYLSESLPETQEPLVIRLHGSEDSEGPPGPGAEKSPTGFPAPRRKSSVRFGHATYREIEKHSEFSNIESVPKRFGTVMSAFVVVCIFVALYIIYAFAPRIKERLVHACTTAACKDAMAYLANVSDDRIQPCADFYGHVCGLWASHRDVKAGSFIRDAVASLWSKANKTLLEAAAASPHRHGTHIFQSFYKSCYNFMGNRSLPTGSARAVFQSNFGTLQDFLDIPYPSVLTTLIRVSMSHGLDSIFGVRLVEDRLYSKLMISHRTSIRQKFRDDATLKEVDNYLLECFQNASSYRFQDHLQKVLLLDDEVRNIFGSESLVQKEMYFEDTGHLTKHLTARAWMETVNTVLPPEHKVSFEARIKTRGFNVIRQVFDLLDAKNDPTLRTVYLYVQLASDVLRLDHRRRFVDSAEDIVHVCLEESQKVLTRTWSYIFASVSKEPPHDITIETHYSLISDTVVNLDRATWMDGDTRRKARQVLRNITLTYFPTVSNNMALPSSMTYVNITMSTETDFLSDYISLLGKEQRVLHKFPPHEEQNRVNRLQLDGPLSYLEHLGSVLVPTAYVFPPIYYSHGMPLYFDLATLGVLIAKELSEVIGPLAGSTWWTSAAKTGFNAYFQCVARILKKMHPAQDVDEAKLSDSVFAWTRSLRVVYDLIKSELSELKSHGAPDAERVFFKRFCLLSCSSYQGRRPLTSWQQCMLPLLNMREFVDAFQCPLEVGADVRRCNAQ